MPEQTQLRISLYKHLPAACYEYDPRAVEVARRVADLITAHAPRVVVEHEGKIFRLHVHVIAIDCEEATELRRFRDRLREDANLRRAYIARKQAIIQSGISDTIDYSEAKGPFIKEALDL